MVLCENSVFEKKKRNLIELDIIKTRVDGVIGIKLFLTFFHRKWRLALWGLSVYIKPALKGLMKRSVCHKNEAIINTSLIVENKSVQQR